MKVKSSILSAVLFFGLMQPVSAFPQSPNVVRGAAGTAADETRNRMSTDQRTTLVSIIPREGLAFYLEMGNAGLAGVASTGNSVMAVSKMLAAGPLKVTTDDLAAFAMSNAAALSNAKLALVGYGAGGAAAVVEAANAADAEQLSAGMTRLFGTRRPSAKAAATDVVVTVRGRMVVAGARATVARLSEPGGERMVADDQQFMKARSRFSGDPLFAFIEMGTGSLGMPGTTDTAYTAGALAALSGMPYAIAMGGSLGGDTATVRALLIGGSKQSAGVFGGLFSSLNSSASSGQPMAAGFAVPNADVFVDLMIDWDKLFDAIQSMFGMFAGALAGSGGDSQSNGGLQPGGGQSADLLAMAEASLGFSIQHDLIPTLGNELAFTLSGFNNVSFPSAVSSSQTRNGMATRSSPRFMLMVAVRDQLKFEKLLRKLINGPTGSAAQPFARTTYRGATINSTKSMAYTITDGFLLAGGSAAEIRHALDAHALGNSLASTSEFRQALGNSRQATVRAFLSSRLSKELYELLSKEAARSGGTSPAFEPQMTSPISFSMTPDEDGLMIEAHLPANLAVMGLAAMLAAKPAPYGISRSSGVGASDSASPRTGGPATPKLTNDDLRFRRP